MYKTILVATLFLLFAGIAYYLIEIKPSFKVERANAFSDWAEFIPQSKRFKVSLPSKPQYAKDLLPIPNSNKKRPYQIYASEKIDGTVFMISVITYPPEVDTSNSHEMLKGLVDELVQSKIDNRLNKIDKSQFQEYDSVDFKISSSDLEAQGKAIQVDNNVFILTYIAKHSDLNQMEFEHFIDSFIILPKQ
jgi:hypothetical protein